jgi:beta-galactosidase GanA
MHYNGGNIIMVQIENEYGFIKDAEFEYIKIIRATLEENNITGLFYSADHFLRINKRLLFSD